MRSGRKSEAQTPSPKKDQIKGSKVNPKGSASSAKSAKSIELSDSIITTLENKRDEYNKKHPNGKVTLGALKAVFRRGSGAFSSSHRPNMTRSGWAFARVNKFLLKKGGTKVKAAYVQDDDLMAMGGVVIKKLDGTLVKLGTQNYIVKGNYNNQVKHKKELANILLSKGLKEYSYEVSPSTQSYYLEYANDKREVSIRLSNHTKSSIFDDGEYEFLFAKEDNDGYLRVEIHISSNQDFEDAKKWIEENIPNDDLMERGAILDSIDPYGQLKSLIEEGVVDLKFYETTPEHAKEYGIQANKPLYVQNLIVIDKERLKGIGKKVLHHLDNYANENGNDVIFGYLANKSSFSRDSRQSIYSDIDMIKNWLHNNGYAINNETNEFHKVVKTNNEDGGEVSSSVRKFYDWFINWYKNGKIYEKINIFISIPNEFTKIETKSDYVILDLFEKIDQNIDAKKYMEEIISKADEFGVLIYLEAIPRYKHINDSKKKKKITKEYLQSYYSKFNFKPIKGAWMKREPKSKYENGGKTGEEITCVNCGWHWNTNQSDASDKYICHRCGFDNRTFYDSDPIGMYEHGGLLKKAPSILKIADKHHVDLETIQNALKDGIKVEMEHTKNRNVARTIASHHLYESPKYYQKLKIMEKELNLDEHYEDIKKIYAIGGVVDPVLSFSTPTGEPSKLTYLQQILVRTSAFKNFFGDWEYAGKRFVESGRQEYEYLYRNVSKVIDKITLEPKVVYHGTRVDSEFYVFDVSQQSGDGRPYGYFAHNKEYSENFTTSSQRSMANAKPFLYKCFVNIRNPFYAMTSEYYNIQEDAQYWKNEISKTIALDKYTNELDSNKLDKIKEVVKSQIGKYIDDTFGMSEYSFWLLMARDKNKLFKYFLNNYRYDGIFYAEEFGGSYDVNNPSEFTEAVTIFEPSQVKLADGRNLNFDPMNVDIRYAKGGDTDNVEKTQKKSDMMGKRENLRNLLLGDKYAEGGEVVANKLKDGNDGKKGGYFEGRSHDDGGIKAYNKDTGQMIEVEGEEVIITKGAVKDPQKREFEGEMLTNREILSRINQSGGGVSFAEGGEMKSSSCGCSGKKYKYGGEMMDDYSIIKIMNRPFEIINDNFADARAFADMLVEKLK